MSEAILDKNAIRKVLMIGRKKEYKEFAKLRMMSRRMWFVMIEKERKKKASK